MDIINNFVDGRDYFQRINIESGKNEPKPYVSYCVLKDI